MNDFKEYRIELKSLLEFSQLFFMCVSLVVPWASIRTTRGTLLIISLWRISINNNIILFNQFPETFLFIVIFIGFMQILSIIIQSNLILERKDNYVEEKRFKLKTFEFLLNIIVLFCIILSGLTLYLLKSTLVSVYSTGDILRFTPQFGLYLVIVIAILKIIQLLSNRTNYNEPIIFEVETL